MKNIKKFGVLGLMLLGYAGLAQATSISTYVFNGSSSLGTTVDGQVVFTLTGTSLTAVVTNEIVNPGAVSSNISGLFFDLNGVSSVGTPTQDSVQTVTVQQGGGYTLGSSSSPGWGTSSSQSGSVDSLGISALNIQGITNANNSPAYTILGYPGSGGYTNANSSITGGQSGTSPHTPFIFETATFVWDFSSASLVTLGNVQMNFGTGNDLNTMIPTTPGPHTPVPVPEPGELPMFVLGLLMLFFMGLTAYRRDAFVKR